MRKKLLTSVAVGLVLMLAAVAQADVHPTPWHKSFAGSVTINGQPAPEGALIDAYDPSGIHCGRDTVFSAEGPGNEGLYGYMSVYGDDNFSTEDEGCESGDVVSFKILGADATATPRAGSSVEWYDKDFDKVDLSLTSVTFGLSLVDDPADRLVLPGTTVRIQVGVRNDGSIMDFYSMTAVSDLGWTVTPKPDLTYGDPSETVYVYFDLEIPAWPGGTPDVVDFEIMSHLDPSLKVEGSVQVTASLDVTYDVTIVDPPTNDLGTPGSTIRFHVGVRNDGNVEDEFSIDGVSDLGWTVTPQAGTMHANPGETVYLYFDVDIPSSKAEVETSIITYTVTSEGEPSEQAQGTVDLVCDSGTDVLDDLGGALPDHLVLTQNYPNPFNPATAFEFALPQASPVRIDIINVLGQTVDVIDMGQVASGVHKVDYDASSLSSGVYFYRLQSNSGVETRKMMLLK